MAAAPDMAAAMQMIIQQLEALQQEVRPPRPANHEFERQLQHLTAAKAAELAEMAANPNAPQPQRQGKLQPFTGTDSDVTFPLWMTHYYNLRGAVSRSTLISMLSQEALSYVVTYERNAEPLNHDGVLRLLAQRYWDSSAPYKALAQLRKLRKLKSESVVAFNSKFLHLATAAGVATQSWVVQQYCTAVGTEFTDRVRDHTVVYRGLLQVQQAVEDACTSHMVAHGYEDYMPPGNGPVPMELGAVSAEQRYSDGGDSSRRVHWGDGHHSRQPPQQQYRRSRPQPDDVCGRCHQRGHWARDCAAEPVSSSRGRPSGSRQGGRSRDSSRDSRGSNGGGGYNALQNYKPRSYGNGGRGGGGRSRSPAAR